MNASWIYPFIILAAHFKPAAALSEPLLMVGGVAPIAKH